MSPPLSRPSIDETSSTFSSASVIRLLSTPDADGDFGSGAAIVQPTQSPPTALLAATLLPPSPPPPLLPPPTSSVLHHIPLLVLFILGLGVAVRVLRHLASPSGSNGGSSGRNLAEHPVRKKVAGVSLWRKLSRKRDKGEERSRLMDNDRWLGGDGCSRIDISAPQWSLEGE